MIMSFIKSKTKSLILWAIICAVFALTFSLYSLPMRAIIYAGMVSGFFVLVFLIADFFFFRRKVLRLRRAADSAALPDELPVPLNTVEREYDDIVRSLYEQKRLLENDAAGKLTDMSDYYTAWAHQIKTPIAAMRLILQDESPDKEELTEQLRRTEQYTEMVMCYLRVTSDSTDYLIKEYDIDGIVRQAVRRFSSEFIRRRLSLRYEPLCFSAVTDEKQLLFVIEQVLSNALKYTHSGEIEIYREGEAVLCVRDTGIGILPEDLPRVFEKGYTGLNGRLDKKASGIGLYLCRRICEKLGHAITAESSGESIGTTIKIDLSRGSLEFE